MFRTPTLRPAFAPHAARIRIAALAVVTAFGAPHALWAQDGAAEWFEMVRVCEQVITDQSFRPLEAYAPAPFSAGYPGIKEHAVYAASQKIFATATVKNGVWTDCLVRETKETDRGRWKALAAAWQAGFQASYADPKYRPVKWGYETKDPVSGAILCDGGQRVLTVAPHLSHDFAFRVQVWAKPPQTEYAA